MPWKAAVIAFVSALLAGLFCARRANAKSSRDTRFKFILDSLDNCICVAQRDTRKLLYVNKKMREVFGLAERAGHPLLGGFQQRGGRTLCELSGLGERREKLGERRELFLGNPRHGDG